jgi:hypothetical protein
MPNPARQRILGIPRDSGEKPPESLEVNSDTSVWEIYNYHAEKVESEVVKDWSDSLNTLLVFVSLLIPHRAPCPLTPLCRRVYIRRYLRRSLPKVSNYFKKIRPMQPVIFCFTLVANSPPLPRLHSTPPTVPSSPQNGPSKSTTASSSVYHAL